MGEKLTNLVISENELREIDEYLAKTLIDSQAKHIFLVDKSGQLVSKHGPATRQAASAIAALSAGVYAATNELARQIGENEFTITFHQGSENNIHISLLTQESLLIMIFDNRAPIGAIRFWAKKICTTLIPVVERMQQALPSEFSTGDLDKDLDLDNIL
ncbi:MAG TPA: roadblock/LC7 domain-containing protein [Caldisericia bacterium]|nr:roadblock/LC7 domain-containing protein [Caldisericia bacterium]HPF48843.1 roadblock/LC7 domain-containing protein [Caldisericia bacterium]HPI83293.1 roadblock/LC7 domain-containing protein [Caldisericia bacterium]HPQ92520.1 roadblock/LC7 domain-containing protein [Caldisericia bacterium]HRV74382.1 roadblock/LC7 domain-containing protein [Caldisericia bacterium]